MDPLYGDRSFVVFLYIFLDNDEDLRKTQNKVSSFIGSIFLHQDLNLSEPNKLQNNPIGFDSRKQRL